MAPGRKCPFSGKAKKEQIKEKKVRNQYKKLGGTKRNLPFLRKLRDDNNVEGDDDDDGDGSHVRSEKLNQQPITSRSGGGRNVNRYALQFYKESKSEIEARRQSARQTVERISDDNLEIDFNEYFPPIMNIPKRPPWNFNMSRDELDAREYRYFTEFVKNIEKEVGYGNLSYFELNLETWRQFWRVIEMSDIVLVIVDIRFAALMFPPSLYKYVCEELKKNMILVLNKIDLAPPDVVIAWKHYFLKHFPALKILMFTSLPSYNLRSHTENKSGLQMRRRKGKLRMAAEGAKKLYEACVEITQGQVDLTSWAEKITEEMNSAHDEESCEPNIITEAADTGYEEHVKYKGGTLTIGCIGQPNVGKSSLMNAIMGKKVVSVSRTPGHTKHFQTIYLTKNVILCDCPGLVFPSATPRMLQILIGAYPIAQVREPYTAVKFLAERMDLPKLLNIQHPENDCIWSAIDICDGWAKKRGFLTAKASRLDTYRAANSILRMSLDGKICLLFKPSGYYANSEYWQNHPETSEVTWIQAKEMAEEGTAKGNEIDESESSPEEESICRKVKIGKKNSHKNGDSESDSCSDEPFVANKFDLLRDAEPY